MYSVYRRRRLHYKSHKTKSVMIYNERIIHLIVCSANAKTKYCTRRHSQARKNSNTSRNPVGSHDIMTPNNNGINMQTYIMQCRD